MKKLDINEIISEQLVFQALKMCENNGLLTKKGEFVLDKIEMQVIKRRKELKRITENVK